MWGERRAGGDIPVMAAPARKLHKIMSRLELLGMTLAIVDTPAGEGDAAECAIKEAQFCLVPARPNIFDILATAITLKKLRERERDYAFVLNQCPAQRHAPRLQQGVDALAAMGALLTPLVAMRADYQDAARKGLGVTELNPAGAAAGEMRALWRSVRARLDGFDAEQASDAA